MVDKLVGMAGIFAAEVIEVKEASEASTPLLRVHHAIRTERLQLAAVAALPHAARYAVKLAALAPESGGEFLAGDEQKFWLVLRGLLLSTDAHLQAIGCILGSRNSYLRPAAGLCRTVYEASLWIALVCQEEALAADYLLWEAQHAIGRQRSVSEQVASGGKARANTEDPVSLDDHRIAAWHEDHAKNLTMAEKNIAAAVGFASRSGGSRRCPPSASAIWKERGVRAVTHPVWDHAIYRPSCRVLHAADALDYVDASADGGDERFGEHLGGDGTTARTVVTATMLHLLGPLSRAATAITEVLGEHDCDDPEAARTEAGVLGIASKIVEDYIDTAGPLAPYTVG